MDKYNSFANHITDRYSEDLNIIRNNVNSTMNLLQNVVDGFNGSDSVAIQESQSAFNNNNIECELAYIATHFKILVQTIKALAASGETLVKNLERISFDDLLERHQLFTMEQKNKTRGPNYSSDEKCILINIIAKYKNIIENKKTDATTWKEKENTWKKITSEFNSQCCGNYRSTESLKKYYENQKKMLRKNVVENKKKMQQTGGGTCTPGQDKNEDILLSLISNKTVYGLENMYDSDANCAAAVHEIVEENITSNNEILEESIGMDHQNVLCTEHITVQEEVEHSENDIVIDWGDYKATHLKTPLSKNLKRVTGNSDWTNRRRPILKEMNTTVKYK
ncbi:apontic [Holotrichia oblita]|uniref:Apontic n=1 Tax=Holotrichia oblita TaxID=644536 RepID=A0ACB9TMU5_HOLOL|nr:apontic [Holotrichia oblita]